MGCILVSVWHVWLIVLEPFGGAVASCDLSALQKPSILALHLCSNCREPTATAMVWSSLLVHVAALCGWVDDVFIFFRPHSDYERLKQSIGWKAQCDCLVESWLRIWYGNVFSVSLLRVGSFLHHFMVNVVFFQFV